MRNFVFYIHSLKSFLFVFCICSSLFWIGQGSDAFSQVYNIKTFSVKEGLSNAKVRVVHQDRQGYLWIGTDGGGLFRFDGSQFIHLTKKDGLSNNYIYSLASDSKGNIWIGTDGGGLSRFDGTRFTNYTAKDGLASNRVTALLYDKDQNLWIGTITGVTVYNGKTFSAFSKNELLANIPVNTIIQDNEHHIWFGMDEGVMKFDGLNFTHYSKADGLVDNNVTQILQDKKGNYWIGTLGGLSFFDKNSFTNYTRQPGSLSSNVIFSLAEDVSGHIWIGTDGWGISRFDGIKFTQISRENGLGSDRIYSLLQDRENNMWIGTFGGGISRFEGMRFMLYTDRNGLQDNNIQALATDEWGRMWIGSAEGINIFNGNTFTPFVKKNIINNNSVNALLRDNQDNIWIGTDGIGLIYYQVKTAKFTVFSTKEDSSSRNFNVIEDDEGKIWIEAENKENVPPSFYRGKIAGNTVQALLQDHKGNIWVGTTGGLSRYDGKRMYTYTKRDGLVNNAVYALLEDSEQEIWIGTLNGISKIPKHEHPDSVRFVNYSESQGLSNNMVVAIAEDKSKNIWFGTIGGGLNLLIRNVEKSIFIKEKFFPFSEAMGLSSNYIKSLVMDSKGNLWIGNNKGIDKLNVDLFNRTKQIEIYNYNKSNGFLGLECNIHATLKDKEDNLWFGTINGLSRYTPKADIINTIPPVTHLTEIQLFSETVDWKKIADSVDSRSGLPKNLSLTYDQNHLTFYFKATTLSDLSNVRYKFRLIGYDKKWQPSTQETHATYTNLSPGKYTFMVRACNNDAVWNQHATDFSFVIHAPYWKKAWFQMSIFSSVIVITSFFLNYRIRSLRKAKRILEEKVNLRTRQLKEEKDKVEKINLELEKLSLVARETDNGVIIVNASGEVEWVNDGYTRMMGFDLQELKQKRGKTIYDISDNPEISQIIHHAVDNNQSVSYEVINIDKEGKKHWLATNLIPIFDEDNKLKKLVFIETDMSERKQNEDLIKQKNKDITDSINYAKKIQEAILPSMKDIRKAFPDSFILYKPRDIVSGDFYWFASVEREHGPLYLIAAVDCTGHGVPGAFMSLIGNNSLYEAVNRQGISQPSEILNFMNSAIKSALKQDKWSTAESRDGMDIALCAVDFANMEMQFAGAYRSLYFMRDGELSEIAGNKMPVAGFHLSKERLYTNYKLNLQKGDTFYLSTDGYADQFGGKDGKKFMTKKLKQLLQDIHHHDMEKQMSILDDTLENWRENEQQVDDVLIIGIRI